MEDGGEVGKAQEGRNEPRTPPIALMELAEVADCTSKVDSKRVHLVESMLCLWVRLSWFRSIMLRIIAKDV